MFLLVEMENASDGFWHLHEWPGELKADWLRLLGRRGRQWSRRPTDRQCWLGGGNQRNGGCSIGCKLRSGCSHSLRSGIEEVIDRAVGLAETVSGFPCFAPHLPHGSLSLSKGIQVPGEQSHLLRIPMVEHYQDFQQPAPLKVLVCLCPLTPRLGPRDHQRLEQRIFPTHIVHGFLGLPETPVVPCSISCGTEHVPKFLGHVFKSSET